MLTIPIISITYLLFSSISGHYSHALQLLSYNNKIWVAHLGYHALNNIDKLYHSWNNVANDSKNLQNLQYNSSAGTLLYREFPVFSFRFQIFLSCMSCCQLVTTIPHLCSGWGIRKQRSFTVIRITRKIR